MFFDMFIWYILIIGVLFILAMISLLPHKILRLALATNIFLGSLALIYVGLFSISGMPRPVGLMLFKPHIKEAKVMGAAIQENIGIFVLLQAPELGPAPVYYWFPWSKEAAQELQDAISDARNKAKKGESNGVVMMGKPFEKSLDNRKLNLFYPEPQEALPPKPVPPAAEPMIINN